MISKGLSIVTRSDKGRMHCHIAAEMPSMCRDFDWTAFDEAERYYKLFRVYHSRKDLEFYKYFTKKYRASLPKDWQLINRKLMTMGKRYGLGRVFLTPVRKNMQALKWYLVSNIPYRRDIRDKGIHYFDSWGLEKIHGFQIVNKFTLDYRRRLARFAKGLQLTNDSYNLILRSVLGRRWYYRVEDLIKHIDNLSPNQLLQYQDLQITVNTHLLRSS
jgi:hypothetical protein